jgi:hypothetical protein
MTYDNINTDRHDDLIDDAEAELQIQKVTARTSILATLGFIIVATLTYVYRGDGALEIPLIVVSAMSTIIGSVLLMLTVLLYGIGVAGAKRTLARRIRQRDRFVLRKMANPPE